jgi:acyl-CoA synthetase (AMP-forming)/AMP-acid ligase II
VSGQSKLVLRASAVARTSHGQQPLCLPHMLATWGEQASDALAILAPGRSPLTYGHLQRCVDETVQALYARGLGRRDRVALVLPNGPKWPWRASLWPLAPHACHSTLPIHPANSIFT